MHCSSPHYFPHPVLRKIFFENILDTVLKERELILMLIKHFCYLNVKLGYLLPQSSYTSWPSCPLERCKMESHPKKSLGRGDKEGKAKVVKLLFQELFPFLQMGLSAFQFFRKLGNL